MAVQTLNTADCAYMHGHASNCDGKLAISVLDFLTKFKDKSCQFMQNLEVLENWSPQNFPATPETKTQIIIMKEVE